MATTETQRTEARAQARFVRAAPRKAQLVVDQIRGRPVPEARAILAFMPRDAARDVEKVLASAVANAEANHGLAGDDLYVSSAQVGAGPMLKRWRARARGRVGRIRKRTCHITIRLATPEGPLAEPPTKPAPDRPARKTATATAAAKVAEPETAPVEKPKRARRPKAEASAEAEAVPDVADAVAETGGTPEVEEKPKRASRARVKPAETEATAESAESAKRGRRKKES